MRSRTALQRLGRSVFWRTTAAGIGVSFAFFALWFEVGHSFLGNSPPYTDLDAFGALLLVPFAGVPVAVVAALAARAQALKTLRSPPITTSEDAKSCVRHLSLVCGTSLMVIAGLGALFILSSDHAVGLHQENGVSFESKALVAIITVALAAATGGLAGRGAGRRYVEQARLEGPEIPRVIAVSVEPPFGLHLKFADGTTRFVDLTGDLNGPRMQQLQDPDFFAQVGVRHGTATWPNGVELDPSVLHRDGERQNI